MTNPENTKYVRKRRVFYIPGYDPIHPRRYRELYRKEGAAQAKISDYEIGISAKAKSDVYGWHAQATIDGHRTEADVDVLVWSDIVRSSMSNSILGTYGQLIHTAWTYIASGTLRRLMWMRKGPVIAALYPVGVFIGVAGKFIPIAAAIGLAYFILVWCKRNDGKIFAYYLMHDFAHSARWNGAFGALIADALNSDVDEVLVVGHSSGAHLGISILADLIRDGKVPTNGATLSLLSLGQVVPMVSIWHICLRETRCHGLMSQPQVMVAPLLCATRLP